jgi:hypothetical protein
MDDLQRSWNEAVNAIISGEGKKPTPARRARSSNTTLPAVDALEQAPASESPRYR